MEKANRVNAWVLLTGFAVGAAALGCGGGGGGVGMKVDADAGRDATGDGDGASTTDTGTGMDAMTPVRLMVGPAMVTLTEGSPTGAMATVNVSLSMGWSTPITVTLMSANPNVATVVPETLEFGINDTSAKTVTVFAALDDDTMDNTTTISMFSPDTGSATVAVNVDDVDVQAILATPPRLAMTEGRSETLSVRLAKKPSSTVVVTLASSSTAKLAVSPPTLTFNAGNYSIPQQVTAMAAQDDDAMLDNVTVNLTATGNISALPVTVEITDDDAVNLDVTPPSVTLVERANMPGTISVRLTLPPTNDVTVAVASSNAKATVSPATLTFTPANSATPQTVQVTAASDDDARDETATITFTATGVIPAPPVRMVAVTIDDPDNQAIQVSPSAVTVGEGNSAMFDVRLLLNPGGPITVNVFSQNPGKIEVLPPVLNFNATTFGTAQQVMVRGLQDEDLINDMVNVTLLSSGADNVTVPITITDDDQQMIQLIPAVPGAVLVMQETQSGGTPSTSPLGVRLAKRPAAAITVTVATSSSKLRVSPASLTFTPADYTTPQFVTLTAPNDGDLVDDAVTVTASASGIPSATLDVQILDSDIQNFLVEPQSLGVIPEGMSKNFIVMLALPPPNAVNVVFTSSSPKVTISSQQCALTTANYNQPNCTITVTAVDDMDVRDETAMISVSDAAGMITSRTVPVAVHDDDVQSLTVSSTPTSLVEGAVAMFTVRLAFDPVDAVAVNVFSSLPGKLDVSRPVLNFSGGSGGNWATPQEVTISALQDNDLANEMGVTLTLTSAVTPTVTRTLTITDNDQQVIQFIPTSLSMMETRLGGPPSTSVVGVRLAYDPGGPVMVTLMSADTNRLMLTSSLDFDSSNYSTARFVTLTAPHVNDQLSPTVNVTASGAGSTTTGPFATLPLPVTITDADTLNFIVSSVSAPILEGNDGGTLPSQSFTVMLTVTPPSPVTLTSSNLAASSKVTAAIQGGSCVLASDTSSCTVNVTAVPDANAHNETGTVTVSHPAVAMPQTVAVSVTDDEIQALDLVGDGAPEVVVEGGAAGTFSVRLTADPVVPVTVTFNPSLSGVGEVTIASDPSPCVLTTANYSTTGCAVTVTGLEDLDLADDTLSIAVSAAGLGLADSVAVRKDDNDDQQLVLRAPSGSPGSESCGGDPLRDPNSPPPADTGTSVTVDEDGIARKFCVSLAFQPDVSTTVTAASVPMAEISVSSALTFTSDCSALSTTCYYKSQEVVIGGIDEPDDVANDTGTVTVSAVPAVPTKSVSVTVIDNDRRLTVVPPSGGVVESAPGITGCSIGSATNCTQDYTVNTMVTLTQMAASGWEFVVWGGDCSASGTMPMATVTMTAAKTCSATFRPSLNVSVFGSASGGGDVDSDATTPGITDCRTSPSGDCTEFYSLGTPVILIATPDTDWEFVSWSGDCSGMSATTTVTMSSVRSCMATFRPRLTVVVSGVGSVGSSPAGIACGGDCSEFYTTGTPVMLTTSSPETDWQFGLWGGDCSGMGVSTTVTMSVPRACTARFDPLLTVIVAGGTGTVTGAGLSSCAITGGVASGTCTAFRTLNSTATVNASAGGVWTGDCTPNVSDATIATAPMSAPRTCTVTFP